MGFPGKALGDYQVNCKGQFFTPIVITSVLGEVHDMGTFMTTDKVNKILSFASKGVRRTLRCQDNRGFNMKGLVITSFIGGTGGNGSFGMTRIMRDLRESC